MFAFITSARRTLETCAQQFEPASLSPADALRAVEELGAIRRVVDGMLARAAQRVEETHPPTSRGDRSAAESVARRLGVPTHEVRAAIESSSRLDRLPAVDAAVREGRLSTRQVEMITAAATVNPEAAQELLDASEHGLVALKDACIMARARVEDPDSRARRLHSQRRLRIWTDADGMVAGQFRLTPEVGGPVKAAIDAQVQRTFRARRAGQPREPEEAYAADALAAFVLDERAPVGRDVNATVHVVIDHGALMRGGAVGDEVCEIPGVGPVDVRWARDLLGSAFLTAVVKRGKDILAVAHIGRHIPAELRTALVVSGRECEVDGCHVRGYLERDHTFEYGKGGATSFSNLGWLCYTHHRRKTDGWILGPADPMTRKRVLRPPPDVAA
jgi:Domain of unknown function (DUF222)